MLTSTSFFLTCLCTIKSLGSDKTLIVEIKQHSIIKKKNTLQKKIHINSYYDLDILLIP